MLVPNQLTRKQQAILEFIRNFDNDHSYPPTIRDIQRGCEISSTSVVDYNLHILERDGYIKRDKEVSRGIEIVDKHILEGNDFSIPILGYIAAGEPIPVPDQEYWGSDDSTDKLNLANEFAGVAGGVYALRVKGTSMIDALIDDGDIVVIQSKATVANGDMVVAWLKQQKEVTLKRIYRKGNIVRLQPANASFAPIFVDHKDLELQGKVIGVYRHTG